MVHTGANIQLGGMKKGFSNAAYHLPIEVAVAKPAPNPISKVNVNDKKSFIAALTDFVSDWFMLHKFNIEF